MEVSLNIIAAVLATGLLITIVKGVVEWFALKDTNARNERHTRSMLQAMDKLVQVEYSILDTVKTGNRSAEAYRDKTEAYFVAYNNMVLEQAVRVELLYTLIKGSAQGFLTTEEVVTKIVASRVLPEDRVVADKEDVDA